MGLFGKSRAEKDQENLEIKEAQASRKLYDEVLRPRFRDEFARWSDHLEKLRAETGALTLTQEILDHAGSAPQPEGQGLTHANLIEFAAYARSYTSAGLERRAILNNSQFWHGVAAYVGEVYG
jgi:hypothetical protein